MLTELDTDLVADAFRSARAVAGAVRSAFDPDGPNLI
jgi:diadenosine tetraphosphate (Ap4A) HIT family hydrolase